MDLLDPFQLPFVQRGLWEVLLLAVAAGPLGTWIVLRGLAFYSHAVGTASFPGLVLADGIGFAAPLGAIAAAASFGIVTSLLARRGRVGYDSLTALTLVGFLALGVILASDVYHSGSNIETLLFGSLLLVSTRDIVLAAIVAVLVLAFNAMLGRRWLAAGFDPATARVIVGRPGLLDAVLLLLVALATVAALTVVGALLVSALFVVPAATARLWTRRMVVWQLATTVLTALEGTAGLWLSVKTNAPPGATIAALAGGVFVLAAAARQLRLPGRVARTAAVAGAAALLLAGCAASSSSSGGLKAVATTTQIGDFVRAVGGSAVGVDQILQPNTDPHEYEPRPSDVANAAGAKLVFTSGDNLDSWIGKVVSESGSGARVVDLGAGVPVRLPGEASGPQASRFDPHWWHDPRNAEAAVGEIRDALVKADPSHRRLFDRNAADYLAKLAALDRGIARCMAAVPRRERQLVTDHDAFNYFARRYGITVVGAVIPSQTTQGEPSAKEVSDLIDLVRRRSVKAVFPESSLSAKLAQTIADQSGASSDYTLYGDTLGPADSSGATYLRMEQANADQMVRGFTGGRRGCRIKGIS